MAEDGRDKSEERIRVDQLPPVVKRLSDAMLGIDPNFDIEDWLVRKANEDLATLELDIQRERLQLEAKNSQVRIVSKKAGPRRHQRNSKGANQSIRLLRYPFAIETFDRQN